MAEHQNPDALDARIAALDWPAIGESLDARGYATLPALLSAAACHSLIAMYDEARRFRSRIVMERHAFGQGEYKYFAYPLPPIVAALRESLYPRLAPIANRWSGLLGENVRFPPTLKGYLRRCHAAGQTRPTPLLLRYEAGGYNRLHQDLYGPLAFPLQLTFLLSAPGRDFTGGEFLLLEQRPRAQSKGEVVPLDQGDAVVFAVRHRPVQGKRGPYRVTLRHGVSRVRTGHRFTLGVIFHDAA
jgi:uncharacterized protein